MAISLVTGVIALTYSGRQISAHSCRLLLLGRRGWEMVTAKAGTVVSKVNFGGVLLSYGISGNGLASVTGIYPHGVRFDIHDIGSGRSPNGVQSDRPRTSTVDGGGIGGCGITRWAIMVVCWCSIQSGSRGSGIHGEIRLTKFSRRSASRNNRAPTSEVRLPPSNSISTFCRRRDDNEMGFVISRRAGINMALPPCKIDKLYQHLDFTTCRAGAQVAVGKTDEIFGLARNYTYHSSSIPRATFFGQSDQAPVLRDNANSSYQHLLARWPPCAALSRESPVPARSGR